MDGLPGGPRWSPDGNRISLVWSWSHYENHLFVRDLTTGTQTDLGNICHRDSTATWTPDGRYLIAGVYIKENSGSLACKISLFSVETGKRVRDIVPAGDLAAVSNNGKMLAYAHGRKLYIVSLGDDYHPTGQPVLLTREPGDIWRITWTRDDKQLLYQVWASVPYLRRVSVEPLGNPQAIPTALGRLSIHQFLDDGSALATETLPPQGFWRIDLNSRPPRVSPATPADPFAEPAFCAPDGRRQAFISARTGVAQIWVADAQGSNAKPLLRTIPGFKDPDSDGVPRMGGWSPDGRSITFTVFPSLAHGDHRSHLYVIPASGGVPRRVGLNWYALTDPIWASDGQSLFAIFQQQQATDIGSLGRINLSDGRFTQLVPEADDPHLAQDGQQLYFIQRKTGLFRIPVRGGNPESLLPTPDLNWLTINTNSAALYLYRLADHPRHERWELIRFDPTSRSLETFAEVSTRPNIGHVSCDGKFLYFSQSEEYRTRLVRVSGLN